MRSRSWIFVALTCLELSLTAGFAEASIGFQHVQIADPADRPIEALIWYPSDVEPHKRSLVSYEQTVAIDAPVAGQGLPLVLISHGTGGYAVGHHDTALALAEAGFVVVALTHPGDNYADMRHYATRVQLTERPRQISVVLDYMLNEWSGRATVDAQRIGIFGFSIGGFTALVSLGAVPEVAGLREQCVADPQRWVCREIEGQGGFARNFGTEPLNAVHDVRIKAAFVAAPAFPASFLPDGLQTVRGPVELWAAEGDVVVPLETDIAVVRDGLPEKPAMHIEPDAGHYAFLVPCLDDLREKFPEICVDLAGFDRQAFHERLNKAVVAFFVRVL